MRRDSEEVSTKGTYVINAAYIVLFLLGFLWMFAELGQRWAVQ